MGIDEREQLTQAILDCYHEFGRAMHRDRPHEWLEGCDITMPQMKTLACLYGKQKASMGELAEALGTGVSTITGIFDRLIDHGFVTREEDPRDRRVVVGRLTPAGDALMDRIYMTARDRLGRVLGQLTVEELRAVSQGIEALNRGAQRAYSPTPLSGRDDR